jgi:L-amino acid N-acyltransferase YncA
MKIRSATVDDAEAIAAIYAPIVLETTISFEWVPPTAEDFRARMAKTLAKYPWLVAVDAQDKVAGYVYAGSHRDPPSYQWSATTSVYIRGDSRGQGIGKRLYQALLDELAQLGYFQAFAGIALPNAGSVALHESVGFEPIGVYRNVGHKHGAWRDVGWWQRPLRPLATPTSAPRAFVSS